MTTLAAPCSALMDAEPLTVRGNDLLEDVTEEIKNVHYRAAVAVDRRGHPIGLVTRSDLVNPTPRDVILVDHAEQGQSVPGIEQAHIVEILDHHHIGSIETRLPVRATFDPVGSTSTLVLERFHQAREEPTRPTATVLLGAILSDTVILNSPTTTDRDRAAVKLPGGAPRPRRARVRPRDVRVAAPTPPMRPPRHCSAATSRSTRPPTAPDVHCAGRDRGQGPRRPPRRAAARRSRPSTTRTATCSAR